MPSLQDLWFKTIPATDWDIPNARPISLCVKEPVDPIFLISLANSIVNFLALIGKSIAVFPLWVLGNFWSGVFQEEPQRILPTVLRCTPVCLAMSEVVRLLFVHRDRTISMVSRLWRQFLRNPNTGCRRPPDQAWSMFSWCDTHSKFSGWLFILLKSLWFTNSLPDGAEPEKACNTSLCTGTSFIPPTPSTRCSRMYPLWAVWSLRSRPLRMANVPLNGRTLSTLLTLPKSLTSYKPSYPTTAFRLSSSISYLSSGIRSLFSGELFKTTSGFSGTSRLPSSGVRPAQRLVDRPAPATWQALGLECRS